MGQFPYGHARYDERSCYDEHTDEMATIRNRRERLAEIHLL